VLLIILQEPSLDCIKNNKNLKIQLTSSKKILELQ